MKKTRRSHFRKKGRTNKKYRPNKKSRRSSRRLRFRGGDKSADLGRIFMEIVKNMKIYKEEGMKHHAQSNAYQNAGWEIEELTEELREKIHNQEKFDEIMDLIDKYIFIEHEMQEELKMNRSYYELGNSGQGYYQAQNEHDKFIVQLREAFDIDINPDDTVIEEPSGKRRRT